jgi:quercetin dioxygenase-like cupin family protein
MRTTGIAAVLVAGVAVLGLVGPAAAQEASAVPQPKGVKASPIITSLGPFREAVSIPVVLTGQVVELEPGGQTGRQRHNVPTFVYVLEGTLVTNSEGGRVGVGGVQYHAAGQAYSDPVGVWHNYSNPGTTAVKYLILYLSTPGGEITEKAPAE